VAGIEELEESIDYLGVPGAGELAARHVTVKDLAQNRQDSIPRDQVTGLIQRRLADYGRTRTMPNNRYQVLFQRHRANPILTAGDWPYPVHTVLNAGAARLPDETTLLLCRVEDRTGISHLCAARSENGVDGWQVDLQPTLAPDPESCPEETWGVEDPRITFVPELGAYVVAYTAFSQAGPGVSLATTVDFEHFERLGVVMPPDDKDAALFPRRFDGRWGLLHRPHTGLGSHIWLSYSPDLRHWGGRKLVMSARHGGWWDANKIGLSPPPIETPEGWLIIYHGVRGTASGAIYRLGLALLDLEDPGRCLRRGDSWIFGPEAAYEREGDVDDVVFPCGYTIGADGDTLYMYYGAADTCVALATGSVGALLTWLNEHGKPCDDA
jgi:predicted GH43/DUF377 family glycosyl hydrolase